MRGERLLLSASAQGRCSSQGWGCEPGGGPGLPLASPSGAGALTQGLPPPKPPHRPDPTPRVPGGVDVWVCKAKDEELSGGDGEDHGGEMGHCTHGWVGTMNIMGVGKGLEGNKSCCKGCFKAILCFSIVTLQMQLSLGVQWGLEAGGWLAEVPYSCSLYS